MQNVAQVVYAATRTKEPIITVSPNPTPIHDSCILKATLMSTIGFWVFFGVFAAGLAGVGVLALRVERRARVFHILSAIALAITTTTYLMLATGIGVFPSRFGHSHPHHGDHRGHGAHWGHGGHGSATINLRVPPAPPPEPPSEVIKVCFRQRIWARDFAHVFSAPLFVLQLALLSGTAPLSGLIGALAASAAAFSAAIANGFSRVHSFRPQWIVWFIVSVLWTGLLFAYLLIPGGNAARLRSTKTKGRYWLLVALLFITFVIYGVFSVLGPAAGVISVNVETIVLGITDIAAQLGFVYFLLLTYVHDDEDPTWTFPSWFVEQRGGPDGRGSYARVAANPTPAEAEANEANEAHEAHEAN